MGNSETVQFGEELAGAKTARFQLSARARDRVDSIVKMVREASPPEMASSAGEFVRAFYAALPTEVLASTNQETLFICRT